MAILVVLASITPLWSFTPEDDLTAKAALLMDAATGRILFQKEADLRLPPASTTKVMTAILALESGRKLSESLTVSKDATRVPPSKLYLRPGQTMSIEELLYSIMLASANDASVVLAEGIGGSVERYTDLMTKKAHSLGATNSNFTNPHGLTAPDHYSTTRDLATIFRYAMKIPLFREIVQTKFSSVSSLAVIKKKVVPRRISVRNHNRLLWDYEGALGGKTGYTHGATLLCRRGTARRRDTDRGDLGRHQYVERRQTPARIRFRQFRDPQVRVADHAKAGIQRRLVTPTDLDGHPTRRQPAA